MARISIIIPAYNAEKYLSICLDSIIDQSFKDYEVWVVNDGSKDNTSKIGKAYAAKDDRIKVIDKENGGVSSARNKGLELSQGEFICFVDADDILEPSYLEDLLSVIDDRYDSSICGFTYIDCPEDVAFTDIPDKESVTVEESLLEFYEQNKQDRQRYLWNRLFRRQIIVEHQLRFDEDIHYKEDGLFLIRFFCASKKRIACVRKVLYLYRQNPNSALGNIKKKFNKKLLTNIIAHRRIINVLSQQQISSEVMKCAIKTAENSCCWVLANMNHTNYHNSSTRMWIEFQMIKTLGLKEYCSWRFERLFKHLKK